jgi:hypothetical protein
MQENFVGFKHVSRVAGLLATAFAGSAMAAEGPVPYGVAPLDHVFLIMMENHGFSQVITNPNAPFINALASKSHLATNYFAVAHPSLTNYLEVVGGSNFGVLVDNNPDWHSASCSPNLATGQQTNESSSVPICPIAGVGTDAPTPAIDYTNETSGPPGVNNIDGVKSYPAVKTTSGKTIGDQLVERGRSWKSYQESLPLTGADTINYSDGFFTNNTNFATILPAQTPPLSSGDIVQLYAAKHDPFVYFKSVQEGSNPDNSLRNVVAFEGPRGLYADLASGQLPAFSYIVPNQCDDMHGRGNSTAFCAFDPNDNGTQAGLNPALIQQGDITVQKLVGSIKASPTWYQGNNAIVIIWDEDDYSISPTVNQVAAIVVTNGDGDRDDTGFKSTAFYTHFSLLKTLEAGFGLPCLNHACDISTSVMSDMFRR